MMYSKSHLPDRAVEPSNGSNVIPKRDRPGLAGLGPHNMLHASIDRCPERRLCKVTPVILHGVVSPNNTVWDDRSDFTRGCIPRIDAPSVESFLACP